MPCYARYTCFWEEIDVSTTTAQPTTTVSPHQKVSAGKIIGYTILVITLLGLASVAIWFGIRKWRSRTGNGNQLAVVYQPTSNLNPHHLDRWRYSWPDYPEYIHIPIVETKNLKYLLLLLEYPFFLLQFW